MLSTGFFVEIRQNAKIKVDEIAKYAPADLTIFADDSGLCVDALNGMPGVFSARFGGIHGDDKNNIKKLLDEMKNETNRKACFVCCICLRTPDGKYVTCEGKTHGEILTREDGDGGFGYDPIFFSYELNKSFGVASSAEKNKVSHRGKALRTLTELLCH